MFKLRFSPDAISYWAGCYDYPGEASIATELAPTVLARGYLILAELVQLGEWKSPRNRSRCAANDPSYVEAVTRTARTTTDEQLRIEVLTLLRGVGWPTASVILHWCHPDPYPILDYRALWSLGLDPPPAYDFTLWWAYTQCCRDLANQANVSMRDLDRALWQYSYENQ